MSKTLTIHYWVEEARAQGEILDRARRNPPPSNGIHSMAPHSSAYFEAVGAIMDWMNTGELPRWARTT